MEKTIVQLQFRTDTKAHFRRDVATAVKLLVEIEQPLQLRAAGLVDVIDAVTSKASDERIEQFIHLMTELFTPGVLLFIKTGTLVRDRPDGSEFCARLFTPCVARLAEAETLPRNGKELVEYMAPKRDLCIDNILAEKEGE